MSKHVTYRGVTIDMESLSRENSKSVAVGNMKVNARGDQLGRGAEITKTADQIAREKHRVQTAVVHTGLKGDQPSTEDLGAGLVTKQPVKTEKKTKEVEQPNGDISIEEDKN